VNLIVYAVLALAVLGMIGTGFYKVKQWGGNEVRAEWDEAKAETRKREAEASAKAAAELAEARAKAKVVIQKRTVYVDKIIDRPVYRNQCFDADGLRCLNAAINGTDATGCKPDGTVPAVKPAG
jgi:hypothetical protein